MNTPSSHESDAIHPSDRYCATAIVLLCIALFFFSVLVFITNPVSIVGIFSTSIGILLMLGCIACFILYSRALKKEEEQQR